MSKYNAIQHYNILINEYKRGNKSWFVDMGNDFGISADEMYKRVVEELQITRDIIHTMDIREFRFIFMFRNLPFGMQRNFRDCLERCYELMLDIDKIPYDIPKLKQEIEKKL